MRLSILSLVTILLLTAGSSIAQSTYKIGDTMPDFSLKGTDDKMHTMADFENANGYVIVFTCNHCPFSVAYEDRLIALHNKYAPQGYPVIAINPNDPISYPSDDFASMKVRATEKGFTFPYLFDEGQKLYPTYGATKTPHVFLLDKKKALQYVGAIDDSRDPETVETHFLADAIEALKAGKTPDPASTKAIGCGIKVAAK